MATPQLFPLMANLTIGDIVALIAVLGGGVGVYVQITGRIKALEIQVKALQRAEETSNQKFERILEKIEVMNQKFNELVIEITDRIK